MRVLIFVLVFLALISCDPSRVYENNFDFEGRHWIQGVQPAFDFTVPNDGLYNLYLSLRNESSYQSANLYYRYYLTDSTGQQLSSEQQSVFLFHPKTGKPYGNTTLGDIYDHQIPVLENYSLHAGGRYTMRFEQFMRYDTLAGVLSAGLRVEHAKKQTD